MEDKKGAGFFFEVMIVVVILGSLSAVAFPSFGQLIIKGRAESGDSELHNVQTAVVQMLSDSASGTLKPVGPTNDMSQVKTNDFPPLILSDYLTGLDGTLMKSGCHYMFDADGTVTLTSS